MRKKDLTHILFPGTFWRLCAYGFALMAVLGCGSLKFKAVTEPAGAELFFVTAEGQRKSIGKTPIDVTVEDLELSAGFSFASQPMLQLELVREGFATEKLQLPSPRVAGSDTELNVKLIESKNQSFEASAKQILDRIFLAQKFALTQQFERAHVEIDKVITEYPSFARALSMRASIYFAQQNFNEAVKWYEAAIKADPELDEAIRLLGRAKEAGGRAPASGGSP